MTMPHLMNCNHIADGWCLDCVGQQHAELERLRAQVAELKAFLRSRDAGIVERDRQLNQFRVLCADHAAAAHLAFNLLDRLPINEGYHDETVEALDALRAALSAPAQQADELRCEGCGKTMAEHNRLAQCPAQQAEPVAWCALTPSGKIAYFDGKPMVMPGPVGNDIHPTPLCVASRQAELTEAEGDARAVALHGPIDVSFADTWTPAEKAGFIGHCLRWPACGYVNSPERVKAIRMAWKVAEDLASNLAARSPDTMHEAVRQWLDIRANEDVGIDIPELCSLVLAHAPSKPSAQGLDELAAFETWFQQRRLKTWREAGCDKDRGPEPSENWSMGMRSELLEGWQARAALAQAPAADGWVATSERLPAIGERVWIAAWAWNNPDGARIYGVAIYDGKAWGNPQDPEQSATWWPPTHWMPMTTPDA